MIGERTKQFIRNGGKLILKQAMPGKWIFNAAIEFDGRKIVGSIATREDDALASLEGELQHHDL